MKELICSLSFGTTLKSSVPFEAAQMPWKIAFQQTSALQNKKLRLFWQFNILFWEFCQLSSEASHITSPT